MLGMDLSNYQKNIDLASLKDSFDFAIIKATEGRNFKDKSFDKFAIELTQLNKCIGCYHYARPDNQTTPEEMEEEAKWFLDVIDRVGMIGRAVLVLDWEQQPTYRYDLADKWLQYVKQQTGVMPTLYASGNVIKEAIAYNIEDCYIWLALWPDNRKYELGREPIPNFKTAEEPSYNIWQYTSNGFAPGYAGRIDLDYTSWNWRQWELAAAPAIKQENLSPAMQWCIDEGIIKGYDDGKYYPYEGVTRNQLAIVAKRLYDMIIKEVEK